MYSFLCIDVESWLEKIKSIEILYKQSVKSETILRLKRSVKNLHTLFDQYMD